MDAARIGIVGMGIGRPNGVAIAKNPRGRVAALCDLDEEKMESFAEELAKIAPAGGASGGRGRAKAARKGPKLYTDYKKLCRDPDIDGIFVGTPNQLHVPVAMEAVKRGKHVLVTKPLAGSAESARGLVEAAERGGVVNMMSLSTRSSDEVQYLGRRAKGGEFGSIYYARARSVRRSGIPDWSLGFIEAGGGAFRDMGVHVLDAAWWVMGMPEPVSVSGVAGAEFGPRGTGYWNYKAPPEAFYRKYAADDYGGGFVRFAGGSGLQVESFWASHQPDEFQIEVFGTDAGARLNPLTVYRTEDGAPHDVKIDIPKTGEPWDRIAAHFIECILDGVECSAPLRHGLVVQEMLEALLQSADTGREVRLAR